jgi:hypothetical protein
MLLGEEVVELELLEVLLEIVPVEQELLQTQSINDAFFKDENGLIRFDDLVAGIKSKNI